MLVHHSDSSSDGMHWRAEKKGRVIDHDGSSIGHVNAGQYIHRGCLTGTILTDNADHPSPLQMDRDVVNGSQWAEALRYAHQTCDWSIRLGACERAEV